MYGGCVLLDHCLLVEFSRNIARDSHTASIISVKYLHGREERQNLLVEQVLCKVPRIHLRQRALKVPKLFWNLFKG